MKRAQRLIKAAVRALPAALSQGLSKAANGSSPPVLQAPPRIPWQTSTPWPAPSLAAEHLQPGIATGGRPLMTEAPADPAEAPDAGTNGNGLQRPGAYRAGSVDPFSLVAEELAMLGERMRNMVVSEVPRLASAAEYFFKVGAQGKRFRPAVLLLMASSVTEGALGPEAGYGGAAPAERRQRQQRIAEITEMIHVASLLHDDVLDHADTRRGMGSLNYVMGNKLAVLAGDFLLARASVALASLRNTEVVELLSKVLEHLVTGEIMQMAAEPKQSCSMEYYLQKNFYKTASLLANSCQAVAILGDQPPTVAHLAFLYGRHLGQAFQLVDDALDFTGTLVTLGKPPLSDLREGLATAPVLFAAEQHDGMLDLIHRKFSQAGDVEQALAWVRASRGIERTHELAAHHASLAAQAIFNLPETSSETAKVCRQALIDLTHKVLTRTK